MNINAKNKSTILSENLTEFFGSNMNLARFKFIGLIICALRKVQTVSFEKLTCSFDADVKFESSLRRIQRSISEYVLDIDLIVAYFHDLTKD